MLERRRQVRAKKREIAGLEKVAGDLEINRLSAIAETDESEVVRAYSVLALGRVGGEKATSAIGAQCASESEMVLVAVAKATTRSVGRAAGIGMLSQLVTSEYAGVRWEAIKCLQRVGGEEAIGPLADALKDSKSSHRRAAARALGKIGGTRVVEILSEQCALESWHDRPTFEVAIGEARKRS